MHLFIHSFYIGRRAKKDHTYIYIYREEGFVEKKEEK